METTLVISNKYNKNEVQKIKELIKGTCSIQKINYLGAEFDVITTKESSDIDTIRNILKNNKYNTTMACSKPMNLNGKIDTKNIEEYLLIL